MVLGRSQTVCDLCESLVSTLLKSLLRQGTMVWGRF